MFWSKVEKQKNQACHFNSLTTALKEGERTDRELQMMKIFHPQRGRARDTRRKTGEKFLQAHRGVLPLDILLQGA